MRTLIANRDLKRLFSGAAVAVAAGLVGGAAMQPNLRGDDRPEGPQILAGISGPRADHLYDAGATWTAYQERVPDYVIGTDWLRPPEQYAVLAYDERSEPQGQTVVFTADDEAPPAEVARRWEDEPREPVTYPSMSGNVPTGADLPHPPEPPAHEDAEDFEPIQG